MKEVLYEGIDKADIVWNQSSQGIEHNKSDKTNSWTVISVSFGNDITQSAEGKSQMAIEMIFGLMRTTHKSMDEVMDMADVDKAIRPELEKALKAMSQSNLQ